MFSRRRPPAIDPSLSAALSLALDDAVLASLPLAAALVERYPRGISVSALCLDEVRGTVRIHTVLGSFSASTTDLSTACLVRDMIRLEPTTLSLHLTAGDPLRAAFWSSSWSYALAMIPFPDDE